MEKYPGGGRHEPLLAAHERPPSGKAAVDVAARSGAQPYPLLAAARRARQRTGFAAGTATINRERWKSIREEVGTSRSSPLARARAAREPEIDVAARSSAQPYPTSDLKAVTNWRAPVTETTG